MIFLKKRGKEPLTVEIKSKMERNSTLPLLLCIFPRRLFSDPQSATFEKLFSSFLDRPEQNNIKSD